MNRLLIALCVIALVMAGKKNKGGKKNKPTKEFGPGAPEGSTLYNVQMFFKNYLLSSNGLGFAFIVDTGIDVAKDDFCSIKGNQGAQEEDSMILGATCKAEMVSLYKKEEQCGAVWCDAVSATKLNGSEWFKFIVEAPNTDVIFKWFEDNHLDNIFSYICRCGSPLMQSLADVCMPSIDEAQVWDMLGAVEMSGESLGLGADVELKDWILDIIQDKIEWGNVKQFVDQLVSNLCMKNADDRSPEGSQCYQYFYNSIKTGYTWWKQNAPGSYKLTVSRPAPGMIFPKECSSFNFTKIADMEAAEMTSYANKMLCNKKCEGAYKKTLMGCCSSNMVLDDLMIGSIKAMAQNAKNIYMGMQTEEYPEQMENSVLGLIRDMYSILKDPKCDAGEARYGLVGCNDVTEDMDIGERKARQEKQGKRQGKGQGQRQGKRRKGQGQRWKERRKERQERKERKEREGLN